MAPVLWSKLIHTFHKRADMRERAHRDGMLTGYDSPEAFEEILWRTFWPEKYTGDRIKLWEATDAKDEALRFFDDHMKKIIVLRSCGATPEVRYVSKNNGNIARLDLLGRMFPGAQILVPIRRPVEHAVSLLRQHRNFLKMHAKEPFIRRYMADIGHYEFGALHQPIAFPEFDTLTAGRDPLTVDYWLGYWIAVLEHLLSRRDAVIPLSYEATCDAPRSALAELCARLDIPGGGNARRGSCPFQKAPAAARRAAANGFWVTRPGRRTPPGHFDSLSIEKTNSPPLFKLPLLIRNASAR